MLAKIQAWENDNETSVFFLGMDIFQRGITGCFFTGSADHTLYDSSLVVFFQKL